MPRQPMPDVVVVVPGILGSVLKKRGKVVWGYGAGSIGKALLTLGGTMARDLTLPDDDVTRDELDDGIVADALMPDLHLIPGFWKIDGYGSIVSTLAATFDLREGENFFTFPYDWRRDNTVASRRLARATGDWLAAWRRSSGNADAKLILVAHSMGGIVCRHFIECRGGWRDTRALVTFGTPYRGSLNALDMLANGVRKGPFDLSDVARQFTALYQLLPTFDCYDGGDGTLVRVGDRTDIPNVDAGMAQAALKFHQDINNAVTSNAAEPGNRYGRYGIYPVVGIAQQTNLSARLSGGKVDILQTYKGDALGGDGTVPRVSALPHEMDAAPTGAYVATQHGSLQNAAAVLTHLTGVISAARIDLSGFRRSEALQVASSKTTVALDVGDLFFLGETVVVRARPDRDAALVATVRRSGDAAPHASLAMAPDADGWQVATFTAPAGGAYRVTIVGADVEEAEDAFAVVESGGNV